MYLYLEMLRPANYSLQVSWFQLGMNIFSCKQALHRTTKQGLERVESNGFWTPTNQIHNLNMPIRMIYVIDYCKRIFICVRYILRGPREPGCRKNINANLDMYLSFGNVITRVYKKCVLRTS